MTIAVARVVFDTNILVSGHFWKGPPYRCLLAAEAGLAVVLLSDPIVSELREKLTNKFALPTAEVDAILDRLSTHTERVDVQGRSGWVPQDPDDDKFIDAALSGGAIIIVSGDRHLLALGTVEGSKSSPRDSSSIVSRLSVQKCPEIKRDRSELRIASSCETDAPIRHSAGAMARVKLPSTHPSAADDARRGGSALGSALRGLDPRHALPTLAIIGASAETAPTRELSHR